MSVSGSESLAPTALSKDGPDRLIIVWDEGKKIDPTNHIAALEVGPGLSSGRDGTAYTHCSLMAGLEAHFAVPTLGCAQGASGLPV